MNRIINIEYSGVHGTYWMCYGVLASFASVFLLAEGYSNTQVGMILAVANVVAIIMQALIANVADRTTRFTTIDILGSQIIILTLLLGLLMIMHGGTLFFAVVYALLIAWHTALQPLINTLNFTLEQSGGPVNFGVARSIGSLAYAVLCVVLGQLILKFGEGIIPVTGIIILVALVGILASLRRHYIIECQHNNICVSDRESSDKSTVTMLEFITHNKIYLIFSLGIMCLFFGNSVLNNYMIQILEAVGGDSGDMGIILFVMAVLEMPAMIFFGHLRKKFSYRLMLSVSAIFFTVKIAICYVATTVTLIYIAQIMQMFAFGLLLPAIVHFISELMDAGEAVRGQAVFTTACSIGAVMAGFWGGIILDSGGPARLLFISTIVSVVGSIMVVLLVGRIKHN